MHVFINKFALSKRKYAALFLRKYHNSCSQKLFSIQMENMVAIPMEQVSHLSVLAADAFSVNMNHPRL